MSKAGVFQGKHSYESATYLCKVVADGWSPNGDIQQLMSTLCTMAWVVEQLPEGSETRRRLSLECASVACYLLDKKERLLSDKNN